MARATQAIQPSLWERLTAPNHAITDLEEQRLSRLLNIVLLLLIMLITVTAVRSTLRVFEGINSDLPIALISGVAATLLAGIAAINHRGRFRLSARLAIAATGLMVIAFTISDTSGPFFGAIVLALSAIFLSYREAVFATAVILLTHTFWTLFVTPVTTALFMNIYFSALILAFVRFRNRIEIERQRELREKNERLQASETALQQVNLTLEQKVEERTHELVVAKDEAERANNVKSAFLASMSHELRTPLNAVINLTALVAGGVLGEVSTEQSSTLNEVVESGKHLLNLINDVLDMSKIESGSLQLVAEENVDLAAILKNVRNTGETLLTDKPVAISLDMPSDLPKLRADRLRVIQVFLNIVSNACKFTDQGQITIKAQSQGDQVLVSVSDTGAGIPETDQDLVFQPFKQTNTGLRQRGGTGLGMPISKNLVEAHFGKIWLESTVGKGTTFFVTLPIQSEAIKVSLH